MGGANRDEAKQSSAGARPPLLMNFKVDGLIRFWSHIPQSTGTPRFCHIEKLFEVNQKETEICCSVAFYNNDDVFLQNN